MLGEKCELTWADIFTKHIAEEDVRDQNVEWIKEGSENRALYKDQ